MSRKELNKNGISGSSKEEKRPEISLGYLKAHSHDREFMKKVVKENTLPEDVIYLFSRTIDITDVFLYQDISYEFMANNRYLVNWEYVSSSNDLTDKKIIFY